MNNYQHKETIYQPAFQGIPAHWAVQYYVKETNGIEAQYFDTQKEAEEFETAIKNGLLD